MNGTKNAVILGAAVLAGGLLWQRSQAASVQASQDAAPKYENPDSGGVISSIEDWITQNASETDYLTQDLPQMPQLQTNIAAMLSTIRQAEGTDRAGDPYRVCYAYRHTIVSFSDHPAITGEWRGETLPNAMCAAAGLGAGCVSTAAGAYQIIKPTWKALKAKLGLSDFSPASQDAAAVELLRQRGALGPLERGDFAGAVKAAKREWASLPGAGYGQGERTIAWLTDKFTAAGGVIA